MNKNLTIILIIVGVLVLGVIGYAIWSSSNSAQPVTQTPGETTTTTTTTTSTTAQAGAPVVQTDATTVPYISTVVVKGTVNPNGALTTYWYEFGGTAALGTQTSVYILGSGYTTLYTPAYITGLRSNTNYYFRLSAKNSLGTVNGTTYTFKTNTTPAPTGTAPTTTTTVATDVARTTANLHGKINPSGSETTYWFEYGATSELGFVTASQSAGGNNSSSPVSVSISDLQPLTKYFFRLNAQNQFGTINGEILSFTTKGPAIPSTPTVDTTSPTAITTTSAKPNATINANGAATTYWFEYNTDSLLSHVLVLTTPEQTLSSGTSAVSVSANVDNLSKNTKYYVRAVARNQYGTVRGDIVSFTTNR